MNAVRTTLAVVAATLLTTGLSLSGTTAGAVTAVGPAVRADVQPAAQTTAYALSPQALSRALSINVDIPLVSPVLNRIRSRTLAGTVRLGDYCSASLIRFPGSRDGEAARLLTAGHCTKYHLLSTNVVHVDEPNNERGVLLDANAKVVGTVRAKRLLYASMTGTDMALYKLNRSYRQIRVKTGQRPRTLSTAPPADGTQVSMPSSQWTTTYACQVQHVAATVVEGEWTYQNSLRFTYPDDSCVTRGGTSGSPVVDNRTGKVVGVMSTYNFGDAACTYENPCEKDGARTVYNQALQNYGQASYGLTTCVDDRLRLRLDQAGCILPRRIP